MNWITHVGDFFSFPLNGVAEIFLHHPHRCHGVGAQRLNDLQRSHQAIMVDFAKNNVQFVARFFENAWARCEIGQSGRVELRFFRPVLSQSSDGAYRVVGRSVGSEDVKTKPLLLANQNRAGSEIREMREQKNVGRINRGLQTAGSDQEKTRCDVAFTSLPSISFLAFASQSSLSAPFFELAVSR